MQGSAFLRFLLLTVVSERCEAHGKLTRPTPRDGISVGRAGLDENNPVSFEPGCAKENSCDAFVCREAAPNPNVPVTQVVAGQSLTLQWSFTALHVGDCSVYVSYDVEKPRSQQRYVKIANIPDCKSYTTWSITMPADLPSGRAIMRWDWVALHIWPKTENFVQCVDIDIQSTSATTAAELDSFSITNPPIYPDDGNDGVGYRNAFGPGDQDMTGPSCIDDSVNDCWLTAPGTPRNTDYRRGSGAAPPPAPVNPLPVPTPPPSVAQPSPAPSTLGACVSSGPDYYEAVCASLAATCELYSICRRVPSPTMAEPESESEEEEAEAEENEEAEEAEEEEEEQPQSSTSAPSPSPSQQCSNSVYSQCGGAGFVGATCCPDGHYCKELSEYFSSCYSCEHFPDPACSASLLGSGAKRGASRRQHFLGTALIQGGAVISPESMVQGEEL